VPPEVSKLIAAVTTLVSALNESAGIPTAGASPSGVSDARFDAKKEKVATAPGLLVRFQEPQMNDKVWNKIAQIFSKNLIEASTKPDYDEESPTVEVPSIIQQTAAVQEKTQEGFFSKLMKFLLPVLALVGGIGLSIAALFQGPGVLGNSMNLVGKLLAKYGQNFIEGIGKRLLSLSDDFLKGIGDFIEGKIKYLSSSIDSIGKMLSGMATKVVSFLPKGGQNLIDNIGKKILSFSDNFLKGIGDLATGGLKLIGVGGAGSIGKMLGGIAAKIGGVLLKGAKFIPFLGAAVSFYFAYKRFQDGDYLGMALEIASGILNLTGVGWIGSAIIDVILITRDFTSTKEERAEGGLGVFGKLFGGIKDFFAKHGLTILRNIPFIGSLMHFHDAYNAGFTTVKGMKSTVKALGSVLGAGGLIGSAVDSLFALFEEKEEPEAASKAPTKSFFQIARDFIKKAINKLPYALRKPLEWLGIIEKADSDIEGSAVPDLAKKNPVLDRATAFGSEIKNMFQASLSKVKVLGVSILEKTTAFGLEARDMFQASLSKVKVLGISILEKTTAFGLEVENVFNIGLSILESITSLAKSVKDDITTQVTNIYNSLKDKIEKAKNTFSSIIDKIAEASNTVIGWVKSILSWVNNKILNFSKNLVNVFDFKSLGQTNLENAEINIKSPAIDAIAGYSKRQVELLELILNKMPDKTSGEPPAPSPPSPPSGQVMAGNGGSVDRGYSISNLLPVGTIGNTV
jgi:hypothetical protein